ncbi:hypothetical protein [Bosea sp. (in: a-proteobacteria)]|jgi:hypothetical protein|uniref:hypothetical protein n=1 Tax=Bosea sp. (in: a-proteobacteria) TaxID=1871050 RepID=UPI003F6F47F6
MATIVGWKSTIIRHPDPIVNAAMRKAPARHAVLAHELLAQFRLEPHCQCMNGLRLYGCDPGM